MEGFGNCLFGSLGTVLHDDEFSHPYVRKIVTNEMRANPDMYFALAKSIYPKIESMKDYKEYVDIMTEDQTWVIMFV